MQIIPYHTQTTAKVLGICAPRIQVQPPVDFWGVTWESGCQAGVHIRHPRDCPFPLFCTPPKVTKYAVGPGMSQQDSLTLTNRALGRRLPAPNVFLFTPTPSETPGPGSIGYHRGLATPAENRKLSYGSCLFDLSSTLVIYSTHQRLNGITGVPRSVVNRATMCKKTCIYIYIYIYMHIYI